MLVADQGRTANWRRWMDTTISDQVVMLHDYRDMWNRVWPMIVANDSLPDSPWWGFMRDTYGVSQAMTVRRQAEANDDRVHSLGRVIFEIADDASILKVSDWLEFWTHLPGTTSFATAQWRKHFGAGAELNPAIPEADLQQLKTAAEPVKTFVDRELAHSDRRRVSSLAFADIDNAIDVIGHLFQKYQFLLFARSQALIPAELTDLLKVFEQPWRHLD